MDDEIRKTLDDPKSRQALMEGHLSHYFGNVRGCRESMRVFYEDMQRRFGEDYLCNFRQHIALADEE